MSSALFLSHAGADRATAVELEHRLSHPPLGLTLRRQRFALAPLGDAGDSPVVDVLMGCAVLAVLLSPRWLRSTLCSRGLLDAQRAGKPCVVLVHPGLPRNPVDAAQRGQRAELEQALLGHPAEAALRQAPWIWLTDAAGGALSSPDWAPLAKALGMVHRLAPPESKKLTAPAQAPDDGTQPVEINPGDADPDPAAAAETAGGTTEPPAAAEVLTPEAQAHEQAPSPASVPAVEAVAPHIANDNGSPWAAAYWGAQARALALAARVAGNGPPDAALALAAAAADTAVLPETRSTLLGLLRQHRMLRRVFHHHPSDRPVRALALSPDGRWLASGDTRVNLSDDRPARLCLTELASLALRETTHSRTGAISALAWGEKYLAVASRGSIGWLRWDDEAQRFRGRAPVALPEPLYPLWMAWAGAFSPDGEDWLAWGCEEGLIGFLRPRGKERYEARLAHAGQPDALQGLAWLPDGQILTLEHHQLLLRPFPSLEPAVPLLTMERAFSLWSQDGHWAVAGVLRGRMGVARGFGEDLLRFEPADRGFPFRAQDLHPQSEASLWLISHQVDAPAPTVPGAAGLPVAVPPLATGVPALALGPDLANPNRPLQALLPSEGVLCAATVADMQRYRLISADAANGQLHLWDLRQQHPLLWPSLPPGCARLVAAGPQDLLVWCDPQGALHLGINDVGERPERLHPGFLPDRLVSFDHGRWLLALGGQGECAAFDLVKQERCKNLSWPNGLARVAAHLAAGATHAPRCAQIDPDGTLWLMEGEPGSWHPLARWTVPGQALALHLSPTGDEVAAVLVQGVVRVARWSLNAPSGAPTAAGPEWLAVMRRTEVAPLLLHEAGVLMADETELSSVSASGEAREVLHLPGHGLPVRRLACTGELWMSLGARPSSPDDDELRLWSNEGRALGVIDVPGRAANLVVSSNGQHVWLLLTTGEIWRIPLTGAVWVRVARALAGRDLNNTERRQHGLAPLLVAPEAETPVSEL